MAILNPDHLLEQADRLTLTVTAGRPRQVDLRRAISSAYYATFHTISTAAADEFVGLTQRASLEHGLVMRSIDHKTIKSICLEISKTSPTAPYRVALARAAFGHEIRSFAAAFPNLQDDRHSADYDSLVRYTTSDAKGAIATARAAIAAFRSAPPAERKALLYVILFPPRR